MEAQCPVPKLFASDCFRGENEFFSMGCHTGSINPRKAHAQHVVGQHKTDANAMFLFSYFLGGGGEGCTCFVSFSLSLLLFLGCLIFTLNDGLIIFYVSFFLMREKRRKERMKWGV